MAYRKSRTKRIAQTTGIILAVGGLLVGTFFGGGLKSLIQRFTSKQA